MYFVILSSNHYRYLTRPTRCNHYKYADQPTRFPIFFIRVDTVIVHRVEFKGPMWSIHGPLMGWTKPIFLAIERTSDTRTRHFEAFEHCFSTIQKCKCFK